MEEWRRLEGDGDRLAMLAELLDDGLKEAPLRDLARRTRKGAVDDFPQLAAGLAELSDERRRELRSALGL